MDDSEPWRNKGAVQVVTVLDVVLATLLGFLYLYYGVVFAAGVEVFPGGFSPPSAGFLSFVFALVAISFVSIQAYIAAKLFIALKQEEAEGKDCIRKGQWWLKGSAFFCLLLLIKLFLLALFQFGSSNALDFVLTAMEILLRTFGLYTVKELMDDLRAEAGRGMPRSISVIVMSDLLKMQGLGEEEVEQN